MTPFCSLPRRATMNVVFLLMLLISFVQIQCNHAFQPAIPGKHSSFTLTKPTQLSMSISGGGGFGSGNKQSLPQKQPSPLKQPSAQKKATAAGDFAYQEMRVQLNEMKKQNVPSGALQPSKLEELEGYVRTVLNNRKDLSMPFSEIGKELLPQSKWRLAFSTANAVLGDLPRDATVYLDILDEENLDYKLQFTKKTMGLSSITAKSKYTFDSGPVQPGLLTFVYDKITTDVLGLSNVGVGFFGLLKGRANYVESKYFDGTFWIEQGLSPRGEEDFINVYMRADD